MGLFNLVKKGINKASGRVCYTINDLQNAINAGNTMIEAEAKNDRIYIEFEEFMRQNGYSIRSTREKHKEKTRQGLILGITYKHKSKLQNIRIIFYKD
ncbi:MAG: hypothetical protein LBP70_02970 [Mycoplasmataceae bacterium]|jgi:hypothetical protein|nr:hypothetical protein [Mycoplasmataceae bacterium]